MNYLEERKLRKMGLAPKLPTRKEKKPLKKLSDKRKVELAELKMGEDNALDKWFLERRKEMTGKCANCGKPSCKKDDEKYHFSIAHILPKAYFPSVKTHPQNFIELCFWGENSCHTQMDNKLLDLIDMNCFDQIVTKFVSIYPFIAKEERRRIPQVLLDYIEVEK